MPTKTIHAFVSGRVQGVFYRQSTQKKARELNLTGWVRNLPDKHVELMASGELPNVDNDSAFSRPQAGCSSAVGNQLINHAFHANAPAATSPG